MNKNIKLVKKDDLFVNNGILVDMIDEKTAAEILRKYQYSHAIIFEGRIPNGLHIDSRTVTRQKKVWHSSMGYKTTHILPYKKLQNQVGHYDLILALLEHGLEFTGPTAWPWPRKVLEIHISDNEGDDPLYTEDYFKDYK